ncbi:hypothetical protein R1sor_020444 [Riccia sorocarpa]|uniref:Uncharacterized protein n=1 Tax=Riccia sorocarpa TaxID=122646 RepID=A0ABD3IFL0_9MARC
MVGVVIGNHFLPTPCMGLEHLSRKQEGFEMAVSFLTTLRESTVESSLLRALSAMEGFFLSRFRSGELHSSTPQKCCGMENLWITKSDEGGPWVGAAYSVFIKLLLELIGKVGVSATVHVGIFRTLVQFVRLESPGMFSDLLCEKLMTFLATEKSKDASAQKDLLNTLKSSVTSLRPLSSQEECEYYMKSRLLSSQPEGCTVAASDTFLSSLAVQVDEELGQLAACKDSGTNDLPEKGLRCGRKMKCADWIVSAARGKEDDDDDDDDDDDEEEDDDEEDEKDVVGGEEDDVEGEEGDEEGDDEEEDDEGEGDDNGEDDDGEEEDAEDDDEDGEGEEEEDDEEGDQDEEEDEDDTEAESEEDVEPPKKKRK